MQAKVGNENPLLRDWLSFLKPVFKVGTQRNACIDPYQSSCLYKKPSSSWFLFALETFIAKGCAPYLNEDNVSRSSVPGKEMSAVRSGQDKVVAPPACLLNSHHRVVQTNFKKITFMSLPEDLRSCSKSSVSENRIKKIGALRFS